MKHLLAALACLLFCQPAVSQIVPLRPREILLDTTTYDATRLYLLRADSVLQVRAALISSLQSEVLVLTGQVKNRTAEVDRERSISTQLRVDKQELQQEVNKALALPLRPPFYADTRALGLGALLFVVGILVGKH